jgi:hypothetical protein
MGLCCGGSSWMGSFAGGARMQNFESIPVGCETPRKR